MVQKLKFYFPRLNTSYLLSEVATVLIIVKDLHFALPFILPTTFTVHIFVLYDIYKQAKLITQFYKK